MKDNLNTDSRLDYLSNAIHAEKLNTLSAEDLVVYGRSFLSAEDGAAGLNLGVSPGRNIIIISRPREEAPPQHTDYPCISL